MRVLWCVCGAEYFLEESVSVLEGLGDVTVVLSSAAQEVASMYLLLERIKAAAKETVYESRHGDSSTLIMRLGRFDKVVVAPCSGNTAAKLAHGIADSLVTNVVSQALKGGVSVVILPTDAAKTVTGKTVSGGKITLTCRRVDLENVRKLRREVKVVKNAEELGKSI
ncbi:MAG: flavoprotein [Candidatus Altiarchaeota archaeon]